MYFETHKEDQRILEKKVLNFFIVDLGKIDTVTNNLKLE